MKKLNIIGSVIPAHIIKYAQNPDYTILKSFLSVNPLSFIKDEENPRLALPIINKESYDSDINKTLFSELAHNKANYLILDLLDCRLNVQKIKIKNIDNPYYVTDNNGFAEAVKNIDYENIETICSIDISEKEWFSIFSEYVSKLLNIYKPSQIIVVDVREAFLYITSHNNIYNLGSIQNATKRLLFYEKIYSIFKIVAPNLNYIPCPEVWYCDAGEEKPFPFKLSNEYYDYAAKVLKAIVYEDKNADIKNLCLECSENICAKIRQIDPREKIWRDVKLDNFNGKYSDDFGNEIDTGGNAIDIFLKGGDNHINIHAGSSIKKLRLTLGRNNTIIIGENVQIGIENNIILETNCSLNIGEQTIFQNNVTLNLLANSCLTAGKANTFRHHLNIYLNKNCDLKIGDNNLLPSDAEFCLFNESEMVIGNNNSIYKKCVITCHSYTKTIIKDNTLWSSEIELISGDGHSIFDIESGEKINDMKKVSEGRNSIVINDHVWIGRRALLLNGANIGEGSIIGANSLVKKRFPNNCILAGNPAKIIKYNISWSRNNDIDDISFCEPYIKNTEENN